MYTPPPPRKDLKIVLKTVTDRKRIFVNSLLFVAFLRLRSHCLSGGCGGPRCPGPEYVPNGSVESNGKGIQPYSSIRVLSNAKLIMGQHSGPAWQLHLHGTRELVYSGRVKTWRPWAMVTEGRLTGAPLCQGQWSILTVHWQWEGITPTENKSLGNDIFVGLQVYCLQVQVAPLLSGTEQSHVA